MKRFPVMPGMKFDLNRMISLLKRLGDPQDDFPSIQVVGTNGKGSVTAMLTQILQESGYKVGMYTSPHLERINERFRIGSATISDKELKGLIAIVKKRCSTPLTEFEFLTALAFMWFSKQKVDVAVLEAGLGGRLDATNVVRHVLASVITNIDLEHKEWLGDTIKKIAREKGGIIKPRTPVITSASGQGLEVIKQIASEKKAGLINVSGNNAHIKTNLIGSHQNKNAALSFETIRMLKGFFPKCKERTAKDALRRVSWPGRFEKVVVGDGRRKKIVILDGAHNPAAIKILIRTLSQNDLRKVDLLFGVLKDKEMGAMVSELARVSNRIIVVRVPSSRSADPVQLAKMREWKGLAKIGTSIQMGYHNLISSENQRPLLITGSLYLVGFVRSLMKSRKEI